MTTDSNRPLANALARFRVMAIVTGIFLILTFVGVTIEWTYRPGEGTFLTVINQIQLIHGFIYVVYVATVIDLWSRARWSLGRLIALLLGGVVPLLSFVLERRLTRELAATLDP